MENLEQALIITEQDIVFECPNCGKSMVIDEAAVGMIVDCPDCRSQVIVPTRPAGSAPAELNEDLFIAAKEGDAAVVRALLARAADVQAHDDAGWTPLMMAAQSGNAEVVDLLLEHGASVNAVSSHGMTALTLAESAGHFQVVRQLWKAGAKN